LIGFDRQSPLNFGITWNPNDRLQVGGYYMYGTDVGISATFVIDPKTSTFPSGLDNGPVPVALRGANPGAAASWPTPAVQQSAVDVIGPVMDGMGFRLIAAEVTGTTMRVRYENNTYRAEAQGVGRMARLLTQVAPTNVDTFVLEPTQRGIALSAVTLRRGDIEALENAPNAAALSYDRAGFSDAAGSAPSYGYEDPTPAFKWGVAPYVEASLFDGDNPLTADLGVEAAFTYELRPNLLLSGAYRQRIVGDRASAPAISVSNLPAVRSETQLYGADGNSIEDLSLTWYARPGRDVYSRVSVGYLERLYGGISTELLWKPVDSQFALGAEVNYVTLRDYDLGFGFQDYDVVTGHVSAYYDMNNGFQAQVDVGQYLAGDIGATFRLDREFENGWKVGGYFTLTDVPFDDFGEGSFDKGIVVEIPNDWLFGTPTRRTTGTTLSSLVRDGGARVNIEGRLYDVIEGGHQGMMQENWGRFWR
ncbi:MAG: YjbH domain-containing protein, partial [Octadecabacter sp.]